MIQDIYPHHLDNHFDPSARPRADSPVVVFKEGQMLLRIDPEAGTIGFPVLAQTEALPGFAKAALPYLFSVDETAFFYLDRSPDEICEDTKLPEGCGWYTMRGIMRWELQPQSYVFAAFTAYQLASWYDRTRFCGKCGARNANDTAERARRCPVCGTIRYPRINPAVIVGVINGDRLLLTRYNTGFAHNALVAGFTEIGETLEETVAREVMEEAGIRVKNIRYYKSQPWGIASDILAGFYCEVDGDDTIRMDDSELKYAEWVPREEIVLQPYDYSLTNEMMRMFKEGRIAYDGT